MKQEDQNYHVTAVLITEMYHKMISEGKSEEDVKSVLMECGIDDKMCDDMIASLKESYAEAIKESQSIAEKNFKIGSCILYVCTAVLSGYMLLGLLVIDDGNYRFASRRGFILRGILNTLIDIFGKEGAGVVLITIILASIISIPFALTGRWHFAKIFKRSSN